MPKSRMAKRAEYVIRLSEERMRAENSLTRTCEWDWPSVRILDASRGDIPHKRESAPRTQKVTGREQSVHAYLRLSPGLCEGAGRGVARGCDGTLPRRDRLCSLKRPRMRGGIPPGVVTSCSRKRTVCSSPPATSFAKTSTANKSLADSASPSHFVVQSLRLPPP